MRCDAMHIVAMSAPPPRDHNTRHAYRGLPDGLRPPSRTGSSVSVASSEPAVSLPRRGRSASGWSVASADREEMAPTQTTVALTPKPTRPTQSTGRTEEKKQSSVHGRMPSPSPILVSARTVSVAAAAAAAAGSSKKGGRDSGSKNWTQQEHGLLLSCVGAHLPAGRDAWGHVASMYSSRAAAMGLCARDQDQLKRKFNRLADAKKPTGQSEMKLEIAKAKELRRKIDDRHAVIRSGFHSLDADVSSPFDSASDDEGVPPLPTLDSPPNALDLSQVPEENDDAGDFDASSVPATSPAVPFATPPAASSAHVELLVSPVGAGGVPLARPQPQGLARQPTVTHTLALRKRKAQDAGWEHIGEIAQQQAKRDDAMATHMNTTSTQLMMMMMQQQQESKAAAEAAERRFQLQLAQQQQDSRTHNLMMMTMMSKMFGASSPSPAAVPPPPVQLDPFVAPAVPVATPSAASSMPGLTPH